MKKIFFSLLAIAAIASCAKTETLLDDSKSEVKIKPAASVATKAAIDGTVYPTSESFDVYGYWANAEAGQSFTEGSLYIGQAGEAVQFVNKGAYWGGATACYWPKTGSLRFAAYSPASVNMAHDLATDTYTLAGYVQSNNTAETVDLLVAPTTVSYNSLTSAQNVAVVFEHALSWITIQVKAQDAASAAAFTVNKVTVNDVVTTADLEAVMAGQKAMNWTLSSTKANYVVFDAEQAVTTEATPVETVAKGTVVIPQATTTVTVEFTQTAENGTAVSHEVTSDLVLGENSEWEAGKHYVYTLVFGLDEILLNPSVDDWTEVEEEIVAGATNVYSVEQLEAAFAQGGKIVLKEDLATSTLTVAKGVTVELDLAGKTIAGADETAKNYGLIQNNGSLVIEDSVGNGKLTATATTNSGWNRYSAVISNNPGSTCTINGGTIEHLGGTDMSYAIDNLTNGNIGDVYCEINGGTIKSTYRAVRQFLNSNVKKNDLIINGGVIEGANKALFFHDPSTKANNGKLIVKGGQLTGGVYLFVTAGSTQWPVEVSIKEECVDVVTSGNVPSGYAVVLADGVYSVIEGMTGVATADALAAAIAADQENISVILTADMDLTAEELNVPEGKNVVVDLGGKTVTVKALDPICNEGTMTLKNGKVVAENAVESRRCVYNYGEMTIENVEFVQTYAFKGAALNNAGTMTVVDSKVNAAYFAIWNEGEGVMTINGGEFVSTTTSVDEPQYCVILKGSSKLYVNGGTFVGGHGVVNAEAQSAAYLYAGSYTCTGTTSSDWVLYANGENEGGAVYYTASCVLNNNGKNNGICGNVTLIAE